MEGRKPLQLVPKPQLENATSMLTNGPQVGGVKLVLTPGSIQDLKPQFISGSELEDRKSLALTPRQRLRRMKSMWITPRPQGEKRGQISWPRREVRSVKITPDSKPQAVKSVDLTLH